MIMSMSHYNGLLTTIAALHLIIKSFSLDLVTKIMATGASDDSSILNDRRSIVLTPSFTATVS